MIELRNKRKNILLGLAVSAAFVLVGLGLTFPIPNLFVSYLHPFGPKFLLYTLFILSLLLIVSRYFEGVRQIAERLSSYRGLTFFFGIAAAVLGTFPVFIFWSGLEVIDPNYSANYSVIAGRVPWSDAASFLTAAHNLLFDGELCEGCYRRPLNASFLAARLAITGFDYNYALLLQAAIFGFASFVCASSVARTHGRAAGIVVFAIVYAYGAYFLPMNMTETLGLTLGALAFAALWSGINNGRFDIYTLGLGLFCLAQVARPGTLLVVAALVVIGLLRFKFKSPAFRLMIMFALAITPAFLTDKLLLFIYGDPSANSTAGNFSYLLYGITVGDKGWIQVFKDYPALYSMSFEAAESFIYDKILENILTQPMIFLSGLLKTFEFGAVNVFPDFLNFVLGGIESKWLYLLLLLPVYVLLSSCVERTCSDISDDSVSREKNTKIFFTLIFVGFFVSLAFIYRDGGMRSIAASIPFIASLVGIAFYPRKIYSPSLHDHDSFSGKTSNLLLYTWGPAILGALIVATALIVPRVAHKFVASPPDVNLRCGPEEEIKVVALQAIASANVPAYRNNLIVHEGNEAIAYWVAAPLPATVFFAYDSVLQTSFFGYGPPGLTDTTDAYVATCMSRVGNGLWKVVSQ